MRKQVCWLAKRVVRYDGYYKNNARYKRQFHKVMRQQGKEACRKQDNAS